MTTPIPAFRLPTPAPTTWSRAGEPAAAPRLAAVPPSGGDFARTLRQAELMRTASPEAAAPLYWRALREASTLSETLQVFDAVADGGLALRNVRTVAMNHAILKIETHADAMRVAQLMRAQGGQADDWTVGALRKAVELSRTPEEAQAVAAFAQENGRLGRYRAVRNDALAKSAVL